MNTAITRRIAQTTAEDLSRLADKGEKAGVRILVDHRTGQHVATSATDPSCCYHVDTERGCTCRGYTAWQRCMHHSLLLSELGLIPDLDPLVTDVVILDEPPASCRACRGEGVTRAYIGGGLSDWVTVPCGCRDMALVA